MLRSIKALGLFLLVAAAPASAQTDIHGTWTAEIRQGKVFLQVRTTPPADWNRSGNGNGDWNMGQSFPVDELSGLPANDEHLTATSVKFDLRREAGSLAMEGSFRDGRGAGLFNFAPRDAYVGEMRGLGYTDDLPLWRRFQLAGPGLEGSRLLSAWCSGTATTKPAATSARARSECTQGPPPEPCDSTTSRPLPRTGGACTASESVKCLRRTGCSVAAVG